MTKLSDIPKSRQDDYLRVNNFPHAAKEDLSPDLQRPPSTTAKV